MWHRHKWSDWSIVERGDVVTFISETKVGVYFVQERFCPECGLAQINEQQTANRWARTSRIKRTSARLPTAHRVG
jgi:hypothetical protein